MFSHLKGSYGYVQKKIICLSLGDRLVKINMMKFQAIYGWTFFVQCFMFVK